MKLKSTARNLLLLSLITVNIGCDQVSKQIVRDKVPLHSVQSYLGNHLIITRAENTGAFLSAGDSLPGTTKTILLSILPGLALLYGIILVFVKTNIPLLTSTGICFMIGGGIGNIFDRIVYGSVTDFLYIRFSFFHTGIFNMADISVVTGCILVLLTTLYRTLRQNKIITDNSSASKDI